jgi:hypothetical protein
MLYLHYTLHDLRRFPMRPSMRLIFSEWLDWLQEYFVVSTIQPRYMRPQDALFVPASTLDDGPIHSICGKPLAGGRTVAVFMEDLAFEFAHATTDFSGEQLGIPSELSAAPDKLAALRDSLTSQLLHSTHRLAHGSHVVSIITHIYNTSPLNRPHPMVQQMGTPPIKVLPFSDFTDSYPIIEAPERVFTWDAWFREAGIEATVRPEYEHLKTPRRFYQDLSTGKAIELKDGESFPAGPSTTSVPN